ncbi:MAG: metallophosphatase family protein [Chloroflexota bacterium]
MRIALLSDIHGNLVSLETVIADVKRAAVDDIIFLGDIATLGPQPKEVVDLIRDIGCVNIRGNHEDYIFDVDLIRRDKNAPPWFDATIQWSADQLNQADMDFLDTFKSWHKVMLDEKNSLLCFHGSPRSNNELILAETPAVELVKMFDGFDSSVMACGHAHIQMMRRLDDVVVLNAGSVGEPLEHMPFTGEPHIQPWAEYAILEWEKGDLSITLRQVPINQKHLEEVSKKSKNPFNWFENWVSVGRYI